MKKELLFIFIVVLFLACNNTQKEKSAGNDYTVTDTVTDTIENIKITELKQFIATCDTTDISTVSLLTIRFNEIFTGQSKGLCDTAYVVYQKYLDQMDQHLNDSLQNDTTDYSLLFESAKPPKKLKEFKTNLLNNGFKLTNSMGQIYIEQDRSFISKNLYPLLSDTMKLYLDEIKLENEQGFAIDEQITIRPKQLVNRILWYNRFISANPRFVFIENCKNFRKAYLTYLITGYGKSQVTDNVSKELTPYFAEAYNYLVRNFPQSETTLLLQPYIDALKQKESSKVADLRKTFIVKGLIFNLE
jgi:hypothetical protein